MCDVQFKLLQALMILASRQTVVIKLKYSNAPEEGSITLNLEEICDLQLYM